MIYALLSPSAFVLVAFKPLPLPINISVDTRKRGTLLKESGVTETDTEKHEFHSFIIDLTQPSGLLQALVARKLLTL